MWNYSKLLSKSILTGYWPKLYPKIMKDIKMRACYDGKLWDVTKIIWDWYEDERKPAWIELDNTKLLSASDVKLLQYTGVKDCNDILIFEGDLIKTTIDKQSHTFPVEWMETGWNFSPPQVTEDTIEIVGSTCENPVQEIPHV